MKNKNAVQDNSPGRRAAAYWFIEGLPEILFSLFFLLPWAFYLAMKLLHTQIQIQNWWIKWAVIMLAGWFPVIFWLLYRAGLNFLKARITYPRTGYVQPPSFPNNQKILTLHTAHRSDDNVSSFASSTMVLMSCGYFLMLLLPTTSWGLPLVMSSIAAGIYILNRNSARPYSWFTVLPIALAGFAASALDLEPNFRAGMPILICGLWLLGIGIWTLVGYLRANPKLDPGQEGRL